MGDMIFLGNRIGGKNSYLVGPQRLQVLGPNGWEWLPLGESRFDNVLMLLSTGILSFNCRVESRLLSDDTMYAAYLVYKIVDGGFGFTSVPITSGFAYTKEEGDDDDSDSDSEEDDVLIAAPRFYLDVGELVEEDVSIPRHRDGTWFEVELARFSVEHDAEACDVM